MAEKNNATCSICGSPYHACFSCKDSMNMTPWKIHTDTSEHYKIYQILRGFSTGVYNKDEAKERLGNVDLSDLNTFRPHIKKTIKDILKEPVVKTVKPKITVVEENMTVENINENENVEKTVVSRKRENLKIEAEE